MILPFTKGQVLSRSKLNELVKWLNILLGAKIKRGGSDHVFISDSNIIYQINKQSEGGSGGGMNYLGEWDSATTYVFGDVVRVSPTNAIATTADPAGGTVPGVYVCILETGSSNKPIHPLQTGGETSYWNWLSTWPKLLTVCVNGVDTDFFVDGQEKP